MEQYYVIKGGIPLVGEVEIGGAKNAALAILAAAIMTDETVTIDNLPNVRDINVLLEAMAEIGAKIHRVDEHTVKINGSQIRELCVEYEYIKKIRASYYLLGALLGKYNHAEVALPGGCDIGSKPIELDLYIRAKCAKTFQMQINRPAADITAARQRHLRMFILTKECAQQVILRTYLLNIIVLYVNTVDILPVDPDSVAVHSVNCRSYPRNRIQ